MKKIILLLIPLFLITSCATQSVVSNSLEERTSVILEGNLLGLTVNVGDFYIAKVEKSDTSKDRSQRGATIYNRIITIDVEPGNLTIRVLKEGRVILDQEIYLGKGQVRRVSI